MRMIILVSILWLICQVYGRYPYDPILYEALQEALISDNDNLIQLQSILYPPGGESPVSISIFVDMYTCPYYNCSWDSQLFMVSKDASSSSHDRLKQHINQQSDTLVLINFISVYFFNKVTLSNLGDNQASIDATVFLELLVSELPTYDTFEVHETLSLLLSWVSIRMDSLVYAPLLMEYPYI